MLPICNRGAGQNIGFPDVCLTPAAPSPVPIPYPNIALNAQAAPFVVKVTVRMMNVLNMGSKIPMTTGDEGGTAHPFFKQMGSYTAGNPKVTMEALPAVTLTMPTTGNMMNNAAGIVAVPSAVHVFLSQRDASTSASDLPNLAKLSAMSARLLSSEVCLVTVPTMGRDLPARFHAAVAQMEPRPGALILDLRGNPGGELQAAIELAGDFHERGRTVATVVDEDGDETVYRARFEPAYGQRLAVIVDRHTASAAELLAASLQAAGRATIVGEPTYGKQGVQSVAGMVDDERVGFAQRARWRVDGVGAPVLPDVEASSDEALARARDAVA